MMMMANFLSIYEITEFRLYKDGKVMRARDLKIIAKTSDRKIQ